MNNKWNELEKELETITTTNYDELTNADWDAMAEEWEAQKAGLEMPIEMEWGLRWGASIF